MMNKKRYENKKGITLVSLVVTIIVLLIIVGIPLSMSIGNNGAIEKTKQAVEEYQIEQVKKDREVAIAKAVFAKPGTVIKTLTNSQEEMAQAITSDYNNMINSIEMYGGFYIGRFELSGSVESPVLLI